MSYFHKISLTVTGLQERRSSIKVGSVTRFLRVNGVSPREIYLHLVEVYRTRVMSQKRVWVWQNDFDDGRIDVDDKQRPGRTSTSTTVDSVCRTDVRNRQDRYVKVTDMARKSYI